MRLSTLLLPVLLTATAQADVVTGRVLDAAGQPVPGCNIDMRDEVTGNDMVLSNDSTNALGVFSIAVPTGLYRVTIIPPAPPVTVSVVESISDVVVVITANLGDIILTPGGLLTGTILLPSGQPAVGVNLDIELADGSEYIPASEGTDALGHFSVVAPQGQIFFQIRPETLTVSLLAPERFELLNLGASHNFGTINLRAGFWAELTVLDSSNAPVFNADLDVTDLITGMQVFTPSDNTDSGGFVDVILPAGTFEIEVEPRFVDRLVGILISPVTVVGTTLLGQVNLDSGVVLSGTVTNIAGQAVAGVDLDIFDQSTGAEIPLGSDNSNSNGQYAVVVSTGILTVIYTPSPAGTEVPLVELDVVVTGDLVHNVQLLDCNCGTLRGVGTAGTGGHIPRLMTTGACPTLGDTSWGVTLTQGLGGALVVVRVGIDSGPSTVGVGQATGSLLLGPPAIVQLSGTPGAPGVGSATLALPMQTDPSMAGMTLRARAVVLDPGARRGRSKSRVLVATLCSQ